MKGKKIDQAGVANFGVDDEDLLNVTFGTNNNEGSWILDSECSYHPCPNKE